MSKCEPAKCKRCGGSGTAPVDTRTDLEGVSASGICLACNGTGEMSEVKPKADVRGVLTEAEKKQIQSENVEEIYDSAYDEIDKVISARLTALQSAHDVEVKELERKILEAIPKEVETLKADLDYLHQVGYNEAIAEVKAQIEEAMK